MKLGDSRTLEGPGLVPAQDHRDDVDTDARAALVCVRIVDRHGPDRGALHIEDEDLHGDRQGVHPWPASSGSRSRPCAMWREAFPCVVTLRGLGTDGAITPSGGGWSPTVDTPSGGGGIGDLGPITPSGNPSGIAPDSRPIINQQQIPIADLIAMWANGGGWGV